MAKVKSAPEFDDQAQSVVYKMDVVEGPQFRMGRLITRGFSESETKQINAKWELKAGEIYDEGYFDEFSKKHYGRDHSRITSCNDARKANRRPISNRNTNLIARHSLST